MTGETGSKKALSKLLQESKKEVIWDSFEKSSRK